MIEPNKEPEKDEIMTALTSGEYPMSKDYIPDPEILEEDSPFRCQHSKKYNQCRYEKMDNEEYCKYHIACHNSAYRKPSQLKRYKLVQHYTRINEIMGLENFKSMREEIGILQVTLETLMNQLHTPWDIQVNQHKIESLVEKIAKVQILNHKMEASLGQVLDRQTLATFIDEIIVVISAEITDPTILQRIGVKISGAMERATASAAALATSKSNRQDNQ